jgi:hypothetical protein
MIMTCLFAALLVLPVAASAQNTTPRTDTPAGSRGMMNCPMAADMSGFQRDMSGMVSDMQAMMQQAKDPAVKERMQKMHERMSMMMVSMQNMRNVMGKQTDNAVPPKPESTP